MHNEIPASLFDTLSLSLREVVNPFLLIIILFIVSTIIINKQYKVINGKILLSLLIVLGLMSLISMLMSFQVRGGYIYFLWIYFPLMLFISPLCYLYIESITKEKFVFTIQGKLHFLIPIVFILLSLLLNVIFVFADLKGDLDLFDKFMGWFIDLQGFILFYIVLIQFVLYTILSVKRYYEHKKNMAHYFSYSDGVDLNWVSFFLSGMIFYFLIFILSNNELFFVSWISETGYDIAHFAVTLFFVFLIGIHGTRQQNVFEFSPPQIINNTNETKEEKESHINIDETLINELKEKLINLMENEKLFLNNDLTINLLSEKLDSNRTYVSYVINDCFKQNFYSFINTYRVHEAIQKLQNPEYKNYSIEGIASLCGFSSRSSFNTAFKKITGKTPSDFKIS